MGKGPWSGESRVNDGAVYGRATARYGYGSTASPFHHWRWGPSLKIVSEVTNPEFDYDPVLLSDKNPNHTKVSMKPGPNNPVGVLWMGLSKKHYGIHGTPEPSRVGHSETNGCIHLTNWDAKRLSALASAGLSVDVRD